MRRLSLALGLLCACGGGGEDLVLLVVPGSVRANGTGVVQLRAEVEFRGEALPDGQRVRFDASQPLLFDDRDEITPEQEGARAAGASSIEVRTQGGRATAFLLAPVDDAQPLIVSASYTTVNQDALEESVTINVSPPTPVASGRPGPSGCSQSDAPFSSDQLGFAFACNRRNLGAFVSAREAIEVECEVTARSKDGTPLPHVPVQLFAEAGELLDQPATPDAPRRIIYRIAQTLVSYPRDVEANAAEQALGYVEVGGSPIPGALDSNPRDGLVTLLAVVRGQEAFFDANGNGVYDEGEPFCDEGEPFLDVDDDGAYDPAVDSACCDGNGNGVVDGRNGRWDGDVLLGRMTHVLWTGAPSRGRISPSPIAVPALGADNAELTLVDASFNPVAAGDARDSVRFDLSPAGSVDLISGGSDRTLVDTLGMELREGFPRFVFGAPGIEVFDRFPTGPSDPPERLGRSFSLSLQDARTGDALCTAQSFELSAEVRSTPAADYGNVRFMATSSTLLANGQLQALSGTCPP